MSKQRLEAGALFAVPGAAGSVFGLTKVIFVSAYYKNVMLIRLFPERAADPTALPIPAPEAQSALYYTGVDSIKRGNWIPLGKQAVTAEELAMTKRVSAREVWIEDTHLGPATEEDMRTLKSLDVHGYGLIAKAVGRADGK